MPTHPFQSEMIILTSSTYSNLLTYDLLTIYVLILTLLCRYDEEIMTQLDPQEHIVFSCKVIKINRFGMK